MYAKAADVRKKDFKPTVCMPDGRRKRDEIKFKIRRDKKDANIRRRRMGALCVPDNLDSSALESVKVEAIENAMNILTQQTATKEETLSAIKYIRKRLGAQNAETAVVKFVVKAGLVPLLLTLLKDNPENPVGLIAEIILTLTNLSALGGNACLGIEKTVDTLAPFIHHDHPAVRTQAAWCLGNIASENNSYRSWLIRQDVIVKGLIRNVTEPQNMEVLEAVLWTMSILCGCKVSFVVVESIVSPVCELVLHHFYELPLDVLIYAVETIMFLSDGNNDQIQAVMDTGITPVLIRLLKGDLPLIKEKSWPLTSRVIRCLGNFTSGTEEQTQTVISAGVLPLIGAVIANGSPQAQKEACWLVSNIAAGTQAQISLLLKAKNLIRPLSLKAYQSEALVRQEALYALANMCNRGADEHVRTIVEFDGLQALTSFVDGSSDLALLVEVLNAINRILEVGETETWLEYGRYFQQYDGIERLEELADSHPSSEIFNLAAKTLDRFFPSQDALDENIVPDQTDSPFSPQDWEIRKKLEFDVQGPRTNLSFGLAKAIPTFGTNLSKN